MFKFIKSNAFKKGSIYLGVFAASVAATFYISKAIESSSVPSTEVKDLGNIEMTPGDRLINSVMSYEAINVDAKLEIRLEDYTELEFNVNGQAQFKDIDDIKLLADLDANFNGVPVSGQLGYFDDELSFALEDICYFKLKTADLMSFIDMIPTYGISINMPEELSTLDLDSIMEEINSIEEGSRVTAPGGTYYYVIGFGEGENHFDVKVLTDTNDRLLGINIDTFYYQGTKISLQANIEEIPEFTANNPLNDTLTAGKYQDFSPVFTLVDGAYALVNQKQFGADLHLTFDSRNEESLEFENIVDANLDLNLDIENRVFGMTANIKEGTPDETTHLRRNHTVDVAYIEQVLYTKFHDVAVKMNMSSVSDLVNYILKQVGVETITDLINKMKESSTDIDIKDIVSKIKSSLKNVSVTSDTLSIRLDLSAFELEEVTPIVLGVRFSDSKVEEIFLEETVINGYRFAFELSFDDYVAPVVDVDAYQAIEGTSGLIDSIVNLIKQDKFAISMDADVDKIDSNTSVRTDLVDVDASVQFALDKDRSDNNGHDDGYGYGTLVIVDGNDYTHKIQADMKSVEEILFSYNDTLNGKFNINTLKELGEIIIDLVENPSEHFMELFGDLLDKVNNSPVAMAIANKEYGYLIKDKYIENLEITDTKLSLDLLLAPFGFEESHVHIELNYGIAEDPAGNYYSYFSGLSVSELEIMGYAIEANIHLNEFDPSLDNSTQARLMPNLEYLDFSDLKVLVQLGLNTSKFNYYHFQIQATIDLKLKELEIPIDLYIRNVKGNVQVAAELDVPSIQAFNGNADYDSTDNRHVSFYFADDLFYINKTEECKNKILFFTTSTYRVTTTVVYEKDFFLDHIGEILLQDVLCLRDWVMDQIDLSGTSSTSSVIKYEQILKDFRYNKNQNNFEFVISLKALTNVSVLHDLTLKVNKDPNESKLTGIEAHTALSIGLSFDIDLYLDLVDADETVLQKDEQGNYLLDDNDQFIPVDSRRIPALETFVAAHKNDTKNVKSVSATKI